MLLTSRQMSFSRSSSSFSRVMLPAAAVSFQPGRAGEQGAAGAREVAEDFLLFGSERLGVHVHRHGGARQRFGGKLLGRDGAHGRVLHGDHVEDAAGEQAALGGSCTTASCPSPRIARHSACCSK